MGMKKKFNLVVSEFENSPFKIEEKKNELFIFNRMPNSYIELYILQAFKVIKVEFTFKLGVLGNHKKKLTFHEPINQQEIILAFNNYLNEFM